MDRTAFERVVEVLAMRRHPVDDRGLVGAVRPRMPDRRARAVRIDRLHDGLDVIGVARSHTETDHVDQQFLGALANGGGNFGGRERKRPLRQLLGDGMTRAREAHLDSPSDARRRNRRRSSLLPVYLYARLGQQRPHALGELVDELRELGALLVAVIEEVLLEIFLP